MGINPQHFSSLGITKSFLCTEAGNFEAVAITFKMDAKENDRNEHEQEKRPVTSTPLSSRPHSPHSLLFSQSKIILFWGQYWLRLICQLSTAVGILCHFNQLESKTGATSPTSQSVHQCNAREYLMHENRLMDRSRE